MEFPDYQARSEAEFTIQTNLPIKTCKPLPAAVGQPARPGAWPTTDGTIDLAYAKAMPLPTPGMFIRCELH
jgi:hypothetical protein